MLTHVEKLNTLISLAETLKGHNVKVEIGTQINIYLNGSDDYPEIQTTNIEDACGHLLRLGNNIKSSLLLQINGLTANLNALDKALNGNS
jgi:hypothetical protein